MLIYIALVAAFVWLSGKDYLTALMMSMTRVLILVMAVVTLTFHVKPDLEIDMVDVGQGDGIVISCGSRHMLIDGGSTSTKNVGKYRIIPFLKYKGIGRLDAVVMTHEDEDHVSGILDIMDDMEKGGIWIDRLFLPEVSTSSQGENYDLLEKRAGELGIPIAYINAGESFSLSGATFTCLNPGKGMMTEEPNAYSTVLYMKYGEFTALFTGDVENEGLTNVKEALKSLWSGVGDEYPDSITLLKVAHHGSKYTTDKEFLDMTKPRISLISCGVGNSYGHPHEEVLQRLENIGTEIYRTDESGMVTVEVNGGKVTTYCPANF
jgi:competence protein ComEC